MTSFANVRETVFAAVAALAISAACIAAAVGPVVPVAERRGGPAPSSPPLFPKDRIMQPPLSADRNNAVLLGVCSGFSRWAGWNVLAVRLGLIALTLFALGPLAIVAYLLTGWAMRL